MNTITRTFIEDALTSFIGKLEKEGYALYMYDQFEDEDIVCDTHGELAKELLGEDLTHLIIENQAGKHTVIAIIPENEQDMISDWAPFHCHHDKFVEDNLNAFGEYLDENLSGS
jgi:hypothetical protein